MKRFLAWIGGALGGIAAYRWLRGRPPVAAEPSPEESDDRADLMKQLPAPIRENLLRLVDEADRRDIAKLIQYPENTAGSIMTTDYA